MEDISNNIINVINDLETELQNITNNTNFMYQQFTGQSIRPVLPSISNSNEMPSFDSFINYIMNGNSNPTFPQQNFRNILEQTFQEKNKYKKVVSEDGLKQIKKIVFDESMEQKTCPIFMTPFEVGETVTQLPCKHIFNCSAIEKWLKEEKHVCPVCRYELDFKEEKIEKISNLAHNNDLSNNMVDLSNNMVDLSNNMVDLSGNMVDMSGNMVDMSGNRFQNLLFNFAINELRNQMSRPVVPLQNSELENVLDVESEMLNDRFLQQAIMDSLND